jgi:two-component system, NtrC family, sensor kinase
MFTPLCHRRDLILSTRRRHLSDRADDLAVEMDINGSGCSGCAFQLSEQSDNCGVTGHTAQCGEWRRHGGQVAKTWLRTIKNRLVTRRWPRQTNLCHSMWLGRSGKTQTTRPLFRGLVLGALLLPAMMFAGVAWQDRKSVLNAAERNVQSTVQIFKENAHNVFGTHKLVAAMLNDHIRGLSWQTIATSRALHEYLAGIVQANPQIQSLWLIDPAGIVRNSSGVFPAPSVSVADRDYFAALRERDVGTFIGQAVHNRIFVEDIFNVAQRRSSESGNFDGVVVVSALPSYFTNFWSATADKPGIAAVLIRADGAILAQEPAANADTPALAAKSPLMQAIAKSDSGIYRAVSSVDGQEHFFGFQKISDFPVYVGYGISVSGALRVWHDHLLYYGAFFGIGALALGLLALVAARRAEREATALRGWRETAQQLHEEAEHREVVEGQLRQAQKMEALGQISGEIAHDFGNVLTVISGSLQMLQDHPGDVKYLTRAQQAADSGAKAIGSLLSFARRQPLTSEVFDLSASVCGMEGLLRQALGSGIALDIVRAPAPCWTKTDRNQMELAILNLAVNARDAMPEGGTLTVTVEAVRLADEPDGLVGDFIATTVKDTGKGMSPDVLAKVFEPFFTTKEPGKGTGLGLSMVYGLAKQSHGAVTIESKIDRGTSVVVYLPVSAQNEDEATIPRAEQEAWP